MAKRSRQGQLAPGRDLSLIARPRLPLVKSTVYSLPSRPSWSPSLIEDRRRFRPDKTIRAPGAITKKAARIKPGKQIFAFRFTNPDQVAMCIRRKTRKEVMHASGMAGRKNTMKRKSQRRNFWSTIGC